MSILALQLSAYSLVVLPLAFWHGMDTFLWMWGRRRCNFRETYEFAPQRQSKNGLSCKKDPGSQTWFRKSLATTLTEGTGQCSHAQSPPEGRRVHCGVLNVPVGLVVVAPPFG